MPPEDPSKAVVASIEDNYVEYLDDECGFAYDIADRLTPQDLAAQDEILHASAEKLGAIQDAAAEPLGGLRLWWLARAWERVGEVARYRALSAELLDADEEHPLLVYPEISRRLARHYAKAEAFEPAHARLRAHLERWPEDAQAEQLAALVAYLENSADDSALRALAERAPEDAELRYEIAEDLWLFNRPAPAMAWLEQAREIATQYDPTTLVDVELLSTQITRAEPPL